MVPNVYGADLEVPPPNQRSSVILRMHEETGHLGRDRTHAMVSRFENRVR